jgi:hypothetical protein
MVAPGPRCLAVPIAPAAQSPGTGDPTPSTTARRVRGQGVNSSASSSLPMPLGARPSRAYQRADVALTPFLQRHHDDVAPDGGAGGDARRRPPCGRVGASPLSAAGFPRASPTAPRITSRRAPPSRPAALLTALRANLRADCAPPLCDATACPRAEEAYRPSGDPALPPPDWPSPTSMRLPLHERGGWRRPQRRSPARAGVAAGVIFDVSP